MKKKIAILTLYYKNYNYGGVLQAYALQKVLESMGNEAKQISYILESGYENWSKAKSIIKKPLAHIYHYIKYGNWMKKYYVRRTIMDEFANIIPHTKVVTAKTICDLSEEFDFFICGSDQIWNPIGWQPTFFFDFLPSEKERISYAASVARDELNIEQLEFMKKYLNKFDAISVREKQTAKLLNDYWSELGVVDMPDPVFLIKKGEWEKLVKLQNCKEKYVLAYFLGRDSENRDKAIQYAESKHLKIQFVSYMDFKMYEWEKKHKDLLAKEMGVEDFLTYISNAELVITDSFHAAVFSSIFEVPFFAMPRFKSSDFNSMNSRLENLVEELGVVERFTNNIDSKQNFMWEESELRVLRKNLDRMRHKGELFLKTVINKR